MDIFSESKDQKSHRRLKVIKGLKNTLSAVRKYKTYLEDDDSHLRAKKIEKEKQKIEALEQAIRYLEEESNG
jgi:uncharacterized membrane protein YgaE (UPF0421/DUF939 family)